MCEGAEADVQEYVQRLKALKWQVIASTGTNRAKYTCTIIMR